MCIVCLCVCLLLCIYVYVCLYVDMYACRKNEVLHLTEFALHPEYFFSNSLWLLLYFRSFCRVCFIGSHSFTIFTCRSSNCFPQSIFSPYSSISFVKRSEFSYSNTWKRFLRSLKERFEKEQ